MKKLLSTTLAGLAFLAIPTLAQAQYDVNITVHSSTISAGGNGGQFAATATGGLGDLLVYCVDNTRFFHYGQTSAYRVFTFNQYVATTFSAGSHFGVGYQTLNELNNMAANAGIIGSGGSGKDAAQTSTWAMFNSNGDTAPAELAFDNSDWLILCRLTPSIKIISKVALRVRRRSSRRQRFQNPPPTFSWPVV